MSNSTRLIRTCKGRKKDGSNCNAYALVGTDFCRFHKPGDVSEETPIEKIYHPYYKRTIVYDSPENCSPKRQSLKQLNDVSRSVLSTICDIVPLNKISTIIGPKMYREYSYNGINVSIFGEKHPLYSISPCIKKNAISITNFIKTIVASNPDKQYDVYTETGYINKENQNQEKIHMVNFALSMIQDEFSKCLSYTKAGCEYENLRMHYIDLREFVIPNMTKITSNAYGKRLATYYAVTKIMTEITNILMVNKNVIKKELEKSYLKTEISRFIIDQVYIIMKELDERADNDQEISYFDLLTLTSLVMDMYTLSRMFREFKGGKPIKNIIVYAGKAHAMQYCKFIETVLHKHPVVSIDSPNENCIDITSDAHENSTLFK